MESRKSIEDFLREVDDDLLMYAGELRSNAFTSRASAKYLTENDLAGIPQGHKRLILNMVSRLRTPVRNRERPQTKFSSSSEKSPASKSPARKKLSLVLARLVFDKKHKGHNVKPETRTQQVDEDNCPLEKDSSKKNATLLRKNLQKQLKTEKCSKTVTEE